MSNRTPITCWPHCGRTEGIFTKTTLYRIPWRCGFNMEEQENGEMYDNAEGQSGGDMAYCQNCRKVICRMSTLRKQWKERGIRV